MDSKDDQQLLISIVQLEKGKSTSSSGRLIQLLYVFATVKSIAKITANPGIHYVL
jgi:hypothetical protein